MTPFSKELINHLLLVVGEECAETGQRASKAIRFTTSEIQPGQNLDNGQRLVGEYCDITASMELLYAAGVIPHPEDRAHIEAKKPRILEMIRLSVRNGALPRYTIHEMEQLMEQDASRRTLSMERRLMATWADLAILSPEERLAHWEKLQEGYCKACGVEVAEGMCHCENDD